MTSRAQGLTGRLALRSLQRPWLTVAVWVGLLAIGLVIIGVFAATFNTDFNFRSEPEAQRGETLLAERMDAAAPVPDEYVIVESTSLQVDDPGFEAFVAGLQGELMTLDDYVAMAGSYYQLGDEMLVSDDRMATIVPVFLHDPSADGQPFLDRINSYDGRDGFNVVTGGEASIENTLFETLEEDLLTGETIGVSIAMLVLVVVFGALVAAGIPLLMAIFAIVVSLGITMLVAHVFDMSIFVVNMLVMIGLAVGIDYSLFILGRYREERRKGRDEVTAIVRSADTASKAVLFSGTTVVIALAGLLFIPAYLFVSLGAGAIIVVLVSVLATLTLLPAVLGLLGDRVDAGRGRVLMGAMAGFLLLFSIVFRVLEVSALLIWGYVALAVVAGILTIIGVDPFHRASRDAEGGRFWSQLARLVMGRPIVSIVTISALLIGLSAVYFTIELGESGISTLPRESTSYRAFVLLNERFSGVSLESPNVVVVDAADVNSTEVQTSIEQLNALLAGDDAFGPPAVQINSAGNLAAIQVPAMDDTNSSSSLNSIQRLRDDYVPEAFEGVDAEVLVTGPSAFTVDFNNVVSTYTPIVFAFVLSMSFLLLLLAFRSIVVPLKSVIMNLLSVGGAYGLLVGVFQHGVGNEIFGFQQVERIDAWVPLLMFSILFGLSMDYHVFLLSRIREHYDITHDNSGSVAYGLRTTGSIITGAALIMVAVFSGFAMGELVIFQQIGFGLAVSVILDATIIRMVLVPAGMKLLGDWNWYFPSWLEWLPNIQVEGTPDHEEDDTGTDAPTAQVAG